MLELDIILAECFLEILKHWDGNKESGSVGAAIVAPGREAVVAASYHRNGVWCHAERHAIEKFQNLYGDIPSDATVVTTLSPCFAVMCDRDGMSCTDLIESLGISRVYSAIDDITQHQHSGRKELPFVLTITDNASAKAMGKILCDFIERFDNKVKAFI